MATVAQAVQGGQAVSVAAEAKEAMAQIVLVTRAVLAAADAVVLLALVAGVALGAMAATELGAVTAELSLFLIPPVTIQITSLPPPLEAQAVMEVLEERGASVQVLARLAKGALERRD